MGDDNVANILKMDEARVDEIVRACYDKLAEVRTKKAKRPVRTMVKFMHTLGKTNEEKFVSGFILGRIYQSNLVAFERQNQAEGMFG